MWHHSELKAPGHVKNSDNFEALSVVLDYRTGYRYKYNKFHKFPKTIHTHIVYNLFKRLGVKGLFYLASKCWSAIPPFPSFDYVTYYAITLGRRQFWPEVE